MKAPMRWRVYVVYEHDDAADGGGCFSATRALATMHV